jgi:hypothetical protein
MMVLQPQVRNSMFEVIDYAMKHAPWMFPERIAPLLFMQLRLAEKLRQAKPGMLQQIELESTEGHELEFADATVVISETFTPAFKKIFPEVYSRVQRELADKDRLEEVLIEIFADFIQRWGTEFGEFQEHHLMDLNATCTEIVAGSNRRPVSNLVHLAPPATDDFKKNKLPEEILHSVEQELRLGRPESSPTEPAIDEEGRGPLIRL